MPYKSLADKIRRQRERRETMPMQQRLAYRKSNREHMTSVRGKPSREWPFCAVDGEGGGKDVLGRQHYILLRAGDYLLFNENRPLTTDECLGFISGLPNDRIYVAYYFDYDVTMILRDVSYNKRERILKPHIDENGKASRVTWLGDYLVEYMPHKYFKVRHKDAKHWITINECGPFFQCSFHKAITDWQIGTEEQRNAIKAGKEARPDFELMTATEIEYNRLECQFLEELMTAFREVCIDTGYVPPRWQGPGYLASTMLAQHDIPKRKELVLPPDLLPFANAAYFGGRFELFKIGTVSNVYEYDINSAYPTAMAFLPCLEHGSWCEGKDDPKTDDIYIAAVGFENNNCAVCDLPIRDKKSGSIYWPYRGNGIYWSWEIEAAQQSHTTITDWRKHWIYHRQCDCVPFKWVKEVYLKRKQIGKGTRGYSLKLAINSLYGKTAQSIGSAPYANPIWAGLITAYTRAKLIEAYSQIDSRNLVMLATDGVYTTEPLDLPLGGSLGEWEMKQHEEMFLVQPGIYFMKDSARPKTRGVPMVVVQKEEQQFRALFDEWMKEPLTLFGGPRSYPAVQVPLHCFIGMKLAQSWHKPDKAGCWVDTTREISFDFRTKREFATIENGCVHTFPRQGSRDLFSEPYSRDIGRWRDDAEQFQAMLNDQPDFFGFAPNDGKRE